MAKRSNEGRPVRLKRPRVVGTSALEWAKEVSVRLANPTTGAELREIREAFGISQARLADWWGISPRYVRKLEAMDTLPAGYKGSAQQLARGVAVTPQRRTTKAGKPARTRAKPGGRATPRRDPGIEVARISPSTTPGEVMVRERIDWMPRAGIDRPGRSREDTLREVRDAVRAAQARGEDVLVTVDVNPDNPGAMVAGYDVYVTSGHNLTKPKGGQVIPAGDTSWQGWLTAEWLDETADDEGLTYT